MAEDGKIWKNQRWKWSERGMSNKKGPKKLLNPKNIYLRIFLSHSLLITNFSRLQPSWKFNFSCWCTSAFHVHLAPSQSYLKSWKGILKGIRVRFLHVFADSSRRLSFRRCEPNFHKHKNFFALLDVFFLLFWRCEKNVRKIARNLSLKKMES